MNGTTCYLRCVSYHCPSTYVRVFSMHISHHMHGEYSSVYSHNVMMHLKDHEMNISIYCKHANIPVITDFFVSIKTREKCVPHMWSNLDHSSFSNLGLFGGFITIGIPYYLYIEKRVDAVDSEVEHYY